MILTSSYTLHHSKPSPYKLVNLPVRASLLGLILILHSKNLDCDTRQHCWNLSKVLFCQFMKNSIFACIMTHKTDKTFLSTLSVHQYMPCSAFLLTIPWQMINHIRTIFADKFPRHFLKTIKLISVCLYLSKSSGRIQQLCPDLVRQWQPNEFQGATVKSNCRIKMTYHRSEVFLIHWYLFL